MERTQCLYENEVEFNLSESGVLPFRVEEILRVLRDSDRRFSRLRLKYPESDGSEELRRTSPRGTARLADHVLVTNGGSEANFTAAVGTAGKRRSCGRDASELSSDLGTSRAWAAKTHRLLPDGSAAKRQAKPLGAGY